MGGTIHARVKRGSLELLEKISLPEGKEVTITILDVPSDRDFVAFDRAAGTWKGKIDADALIRNIYRDRLVSTRLKFYEGKERALVFYPEPYQAFIVMMIETKGVLNFSYCMYISGNRF